MANFWWIFYIKTTRTNVFQNPCFAMFKNMANAACSQAIGFTILWKILIFLFSPRRTPHTGQCPQGDTPNNNSMQDRGGAGTSTQLV